MRNHIIIMGVSGSGKSTVGQMLAAEMGAVFYDADDYHPQSNIDKMANGLPLSDADRQPWLEKLASVIKATAGNSVTACSALKKAYRDTLRTAGSVTFAYLHGTREILFNRLTERSNNSDHFMSTKLLDSQLSTLEDPSQEPNTLTFSIQDSPNKIISNILNQL